jgi:hypothetical protein
MGIHTDIEVVLDHDVEVRDTMNKYDKIDQIKFYSDSENVEIIRPTIEIISHLQSRIKYIPAAPFCYKIRNNMIESFQGIPNLYRFDTIWDAIRFLSNDQRIFYLSKVVHTKGCGYNVFCLSQNNLQACREDKIDSILRRI